MEINIKKTVFDWHLPRNEKEKILFKQHENVLRKARRTCKCPCGASVEAGTPNRLLDLGYLYGAECLICR